LILLLKSAPVSPEVARLRAAVRKAIAHLSQDRKQAGMPKSEVDEDGELIKVLQDALR